MTLPDEWFEPPDTIPGFIVCPWCPASGSPNFMNGHMKRHDEGDLVKLVPFAQVRDKSILQEIAEERVRQDEKWGEQNHPDGTGTTWIADLMPFRWRDDPASHIADLAKIACNRAAERNRLTWMHIALEEMAEAFAERDDQALRAELVQCCAVIVNWIGAIDRRAKNTT